MSVVKGSGGDVVLKGQMIPSCVLGFWTYSGSIF